MAREASYGWWARKDLNLEPTDYESAALTVELRAPRGATIEHNHSSETRGRRAVELPLRLY
jgi:hypothetical protein